MGELHSFIDFPFSISRKLLSSDPAPSPMGNDLIQRPRSYYNKATLNSDLLLIFAALICLLICAGGLNLLLRCLLCCRRRRMELHSSDGVVVNTGLQKAVLKALPIMVYTASTSKVPAVPTDCPICLAELTDGEKMRIMPNCSHGFHVECIDKWLVSNSSCPLCRHPLNLQSGNKKPKPRGGPIIQATESNSIMQHIVIVATDSSLAAVGVVSPGTETLRGTVFHS